jgi:hypothetical protein
MNWYLFYQLNQVWVDTFIIGLNYFVVYVFFTATTKALVDSIKEDMEKLYD